MNESITFPILLFVRGKKETVVGHLKPTRVTSLRNYYHHQHQQFELLELSTTRNSIYKALKFREQKELPNVEFPLKRVHFAYT